MPRVTTIRLDDDQIEQLSLIAGVEGRSVSDEIRDAVNLFLREKRNDDGFVSQVTMRLERLTGGTGRQVDREPS